MNGWLRLSRWLRWLRWLREVGDQIFGVTVVHLALERGSYAKGRKGLTLNLFYLFPVFGPHPAQRDIH